MNFELENKVSEYIRYLQQHVPDLIDFNHMDPVAKMMLVALLREGQDMHDYVDALPQRIVERYCADFIPYQQVGAMPSIALLAPLFRPHREAGMAVVGNTAAFTYKLAQSKSPLNFMPIFETLLIPHSQRFLLTHSTLSSVPIEAERQMLEAERTTRATGELSAQPFVKSIDMGCPNKLFLGIVTPAEIECLKGLSILIRGTNGCLPQRITVGQQQHQLNFSTMHEMENISMLEPFDAQQASPRFFAVLNNWKEALLNMPDATLLYITDTITDRDLFKPKAYPRLFQQWLEDETLDLFQPSTLWLQLHFPEGYSVPPTCQVQINVVPVTNIDRSTVTLIPSKPIVKLQKANQEQAYFLGVVQTSNAGQRQGFSALSDEVVIRDFDAQPYNDAELYRDVRTLYKRFEEDYRAYTEYNGIKDGQQLNQLRDIILKLRDEVKDDSHYRFDSGTYAMMKMDGKTSSVRVDYLTTMGRRGNTPKAGELMESRKMPALEQKVPVVMSATAGTDKVSADERYELLRYYTLTNDRLYTRMDIEAFVRKEIMAQFGSTEFQRIFIRISIKGAPGPLALRRGLYIDLEFKDTKNYDRAQQLSFDTLLQQRIEAHACLSMPVFVTLRNLEG